MNFRRGSGRREAQRTWSRLGYFERLFNGELIKPKLEKVIVIRERIAAGIYGGGGGYMEELEVNMVKIGPKDRKFRTVL